MPESGGVENLGERTKILTLIYSLQQTPTRMSQLRPPTHPAKHAGILNQIQMLQSAKCTQTAITITEYSIDPAGMKSLKPSSVSRVDTLLRVFDVFASSFSASDGQKIPFNKLSKLQKVKVFQSTWSTPSIKIEQIRVYYNFALFCLKQMLECYPKEAIPTIKEYIFTLCELHFGGNKSNWGSITVSGLLQVCLVFF